MKPLGLAGALLLAWIAVPDAMADDAQYMKAAPGPNPASQKPKEIVVVGSKAEKGSSSKTAHPDFMWLPTGRSTPTPK